MCTIMEDLRQESIEIGREKGMEEGMEKGMKKGMKKGMRIGVEKGKSEMIQNAVAAGKSAEQIADVLGISVKEVQQLCQLQS